MDTRTTLETIENLQVFVFQILGKGGLLIEITGIRDAPGTIKNSIHGAVHVRNKVNRFYVFITNGWTMWRLIFSMDDAQYVLQIVPTCYKSIT